jgi:threonine/homoserine/homoserine lactone efflux protein
MTGAELLASLGAAGVVLFVPGPTNTLLAAAGALAPHRPPLALPVAELAGYLVSVTLLNLFGSALFEAAPIVAPLVRLGLAAYLVAIGCCLWRAPADDLPARTVGWRRIFVATLFNPKAALFALVLMPTGPDGRLAWMAGFSVLVLAAGTAWLVAGHRLARHGGPKVAIWVPRAATIVLVGFAAVLGAGALAALGRTIGAFV